MDEITWKNYKLEETGKWGPFVGAGLNGPLTRAKQTTRRGT
jgi:outer membrane protein W